MIGKRTREEFERAMLPHLASAHTLALWLLRHPQDAEDAVQDGYLRAFRAFDGWSGQSASAWLLKIVRNTCMTRLRNRVQHANVVSLDMSQKDGEVAGPVATLPDEGPLPEAILVASADRRAIRHAVERLPRDFREAIVLREFEELSYKQIAEIVGAPIGTVMSRLSRARRQLLDLLVARDEKGRKHEM